jgi:hypothetical protein
LAKVRTLRDQRFGQASYAPKSFKRRADTLRAISSRTSHADPNHFECCGVYSATG